MRTSRPQSIRATDGSALGPRLLRLRIGVHPCESAIPFLSVRRAAAPSRDTFRGLISIHSRARFRVKVVTHAAGRSRRHARHVPIRQGSPSVIISGSSAPELLGHRFTRIDADPQAGPTCANDHRCRSVSIGGQYSQLCRTAERPKVSRPAKPRAKPPAWSRAGCGAAASRVPAAVSRRCTRRCR